MQAPASSPIDALPSPQPQREGTKRLYAAIRQEYWRMISHREKDVQIHSQDYIFLKLSEKFYRSPKTIENIVFNRV